MASAEVEEPVAVEEAPEPVAFTPPVIEAPVFTPPIFKGRSLKLLDAPIDSPAIVESVESKDEPALPTEAEARSHAAVFSGWQ